MKRSTGLTSLSRRDFCAIGLASVGGVVIASCSSDGSQQSPDASTALPDAGSGSGSGTCGASSTDVGPPTMFVLDTPIYVASGRFFVVRDSGGLFAVSAQCTHQGVTIAVSGNHYRCPAHGATFMFNGTVTGGPTSRGLLHFAMCTLANGHVAVSSSTTVPAATRLTV